MGCYQLSIKQNKTILSVFVFVLLCITLSTVLFCNHLEEEKKAGCFSSIVLQIIVTINVMWLLLTVSWVGLQCVIVVFPDHTHLLLASLSCIAQIYKV